LWIELGLSLTTTVRQINMYLQPKLSRSTSQISSSAGRSGHEKRGMMINPRIEVSTAPKEKLTERK
jgi:hypothetical protein